MPAPKGHKFSIGNSGGKKEWETPEALQIDIDEYFANEDANPILMWHTQLDKKTSQPVEIKVKRPYTIEGLAIHLGITRRTLLNYEKEDGYEMFFHIIMYAKEKIRQSQIQAALVGATKEKFTEFLLINNSDYKSTGKVEVNIDQRKQISDIFPEDEEMKDGEKNKSES